MSNSLIDAYRTTDFGSTDNRPDADILTEFATTRPDVLQKYPDAVADYSKLQQQQAIDSATIPGEFGKGLSSATHALGSSAASFLALTSNWLGAPGAQDYWTEAAKNQDEAAAQNAPVVSKWEDVHTLRQGLIYGAQASAQAIPSMGEFGVASMIGGGLGGLSKLGDLSELFARKAAKRLLKEGVLDNIVADSSFGVKEAAKDAVKAQLEKVAEGTPIPAESLMPETYDLVRAESRNAAKRHGAEWAAAVNAYGLSSGEIYNNLAADPNIKPETARNAATLWGIAAGAPDTFLPAYVANKLFPSLSKLGEHEAAGAVGESLRAKISRTAAKLFKEGSSEIGIESFTEGFQEYMDILAERDAKGQKLDAPLTDSDLSRIKNSAIVGGFGGSLAIPITALGGHGGTKEKPTPVPEVRPMPEVAPVPTVAPIATVPPAFNPGYVAPVTPIAPESPVPAPSPFAAPPPSPFENTVLNGPVFQPPQPQPSAPIETNEGNVPPIPARQANVQTPVGEASVQSQLRPDIQAEAPSAAPAPVAAVVPGVGAIPSPSVAEQPTIPGPEPAQGSGVDGVPLVPQPVINATVPVVKESLTVPATPKIDLLSRLDVVKDPETGVPAPRTLDVVVPVPENMQAGWSVGLGKLLVNGSSPSDQQAPKQSTHRATAFENLQTGEVVVLGTYKLPSGNGVQVAPMPGKKKGTNLKDFMRPEKVQVWKPIESMRLDEPHNKLAVQFPSREAYNAAFSNPANEMMRQARSKAGTVESGLQKSSPPASFTGEATIKPQLHDRILEVLPKLPNGLIDNRPKNITSWWTIVRDGILSSMRDSDHPDNEDAWNYAFAKATDELLITDEKFKTLSDVVQGQLVLRRVIQQIRDGLEQGTYSDEQGRGRNYSEGQRLPDTLFSKPTNEPASYRSTNPEVAQRFGQLVATLQNIPGLSVQTLNGIATALGTYTRSTRTITLALADANNPTVGNMRMLLHEAAHDLFAQESSEMQARIHRAIEMLTDSDLGLTGSPDPRVLQKPANISQEEWIIERLVDSLAAHGLGQEPSRGIADRIVRFIKDLYYRMAMAVQSSFGRPENPWVAMAYMQNRFAQLERGERMGIFGFITPSEDPFLKQQRDRTDAALPDVLYSKPVSQSIPGPERPGDRVNPEVPVNTRIATLNAQKAIEAQIAPIIDALPKVTSAIEESGLTPETWFRDVAGLDNADDLIRDAARVLDPGTGLPMPGVNPAMKLGGFNSEVNNNLANNGAYSFLLAQQAKIGRVRDALVNGIAKLAKAGDDRIEAINRSISEYTNVNGMTDLARKNLRTMLKKFYKDVAGEAKAFGMISQQLVELGETGNELQTWGPIFRKLFTGTELGAGRLISTLDILANDTRIDMSRRADSIRGQMRKTGDSKFDPFLGDSPDGKALLATAIAYARTNRSAAWVAQLQKMTDLERRARINAQLKKLLKDTMPKIGKKVNDLVDTGVLEDRLRQAFIADRKDIRNLAKQERALNAKLDAVNAALPYWDKAVNDLGGKLQIRTDKVFGEGFKTNVPTSATATMDQVRGNPYTVTLKRGEGSTTPGEIQSIIDKQTAWLANREATGQKDSDYVQMLSDRDTLILDGVMPHAINEANNSLMRMSASGYGDRLKAFGSTTAKLLNATVTRFTGSHKALQNEYSPESFKVMRLRDAAMNILTGDDKRGLLSRIFRRNIGLSIENYWANFYQPAVQFLEDNRDILETGNREQQWTLAFTKIFNNLMLNPAARNLMAGREREFMAALRAHVEANERVFSALSGKLNDEGVGVYDEKTGMTRMRLERGLATIPKTISGRFKSVFETLINHGWDGSPGNPAANARSGFAGAGATYQQLGADHLRNDLKILFGHPEITRDFVGAIANMPTQSRFLAPLDRDGVSQREIHPGIVQSAWGSSGGDVIKFLENLYDLERGTTTTDRGAFIQQGLMTIADYFDQMKRIMIGLDPERFQKNSFEFSTMVPGFMVNARHIEDMPAEWFRHLDFDERTAHSATAKLAAEIAFGVNGAKLETNYRTLREEVRSEVDKLDRANDTVKSNVITNSIKERDKALADILGGKDRLEYLRDLKQKEAQILAKWQQEIVTTFRGANSPTKTMRFAQQVVKTMVGAMVNQPGSALSNVSDVLSSFVSLGASGKTVRGVFRQTKGLTNEVARSLAQAFGIAIDRADREYQRMVEYGQTDPEALRRNSDLLLRQTGDDTLMDRASQKLRTFSRAVQFGINPREGKVSPLRPFGLFTQIASNTNQEAVINWVRDVNSYLGQAAQYLKTTALNRTALANMSIEDWTKELGLSKSDSVTFTKLFSILRDDMGLAFDRLAYEAASNASAGKDMISKRTFLMIQGAALKNTGNETSIATMPPAAFNNSLLSAMMPLLPWNFRRARDVTGMHLDSTGKTQMAAIGRAMVAMALMVGGGLAISSLVDLYNEELLNKRRNLRRLTLDQDPSEFAMALLEHSARVGTFGLWGDLLNSALNTGTGQGDNRGVSLDNRVVAVNSLTGLLKTISAWKNQDYTADYAGVIRPIAYAVGGGGMIQYLQMANNLAGLDNVESRATARTNVGNWLRAVGREQGLEINQQRGGYSTPTPMTPLISRMTMAAYGNDAGDFNQAFREAVAEAKKEGKDDPVKYVRTAFMSRAPLRSVFRNPMTEQDYRKVLSAMPDEGRQAVQDAVRMFDGYTLQIGGTPHELKREKPEPKVTLSMPRATPVNLRSASASALAVGFGF